MNQARMQKARRQARAARRAARPDVGELLVREVSRMGAHQAMKLLRSVETQKAGERLLFALVRKRHARRRARLQQKASRKANRR